MEGITIVNGDNFDSEVLQSTLPVIVEFWTEACQPCRRLGKVIREYAGQVKIAPCNVDENVELAERLGVRVIPTLLFFKGGEVVDMAMGTVSDIDEAEVAAKCRALVAA